MYAYVYVCLGHGISILSQYAPIDSPWNWVMSVMAQIRDAVLVLQGPESLVSTFDDLVSNLGDTAQPTVLYHFIMV